MWSWYILAPQFSVAALASILRFDLENLLVHNTPDLQVEDFTACEKFFDTKL